MSTRIGRRSRGGGGNDDGDDAAGGGREPGDEDERERGREGDEAGGDGVGGDGDSGDRGDDGDQSGDGAGGESGSGRRRRSTLGILVRVAAGLLLAGFAYVAVTFVQVWDASRSDEVRPSDAIVVLGAAQYNCEPSPVLRSRLDHALELYEDGVAPRIVVTGGKRAGDVCTEAQAGADYLLAAGVPDEDIDREVDGTNTWESIAASANFLIDEGHTRVVLVTDDYHALRVRAIADELGLEPVVSPVGDDASFRELAKETGAVAVGRVVGFRRLVRIDDRLVPDPGG